MSKKQMVFQCLLLMCFSAIPMFAQGAGPLGVSLNTAETWVIAIVKIISVLGVIYAGATMMFGDHRMASLVGVFIGLGVMNYAQTIVTTMWP